MPLLSLLLKSRWFWELAGAGAIVAALLFWHHAAIDKGIAEQKAADDKASAALVAQTQQETAALQTKADEAQESYEAEISALRNQPPVGAVRLCVNPHGRGSGMPETSTSDAGNANPGTSAGVVQPVPAGDSQGPDIGNLLGILALRADEVSAELREYQNRASLEQ